jgi:hypothetical protein
LQGRQRPGGRLGCVAIRLAAHLPQDALLLGHHIALRLASTVAGFQGCQPFPIEAGDQLADGIATPAPSTPSGVGKALTAGHGEQRFGSRHNGSRFDLGASQAFQFVAFLLGENA